MRIIDARILDGASRSAYILMERGEMDFDKYLQSPDSARDIDSEGLGYGVEQGR